MNNEYVKGIPLFTSINNVNTQHDYLTNDIETDVLIVGGGVTGAILGYFFGKNNINATIIEKARVAHGSTSVTTSLLQYELDSTFSDIKNIIGFENTKTAYKLGKIALKEIKDFISTYGNNCDYYERDTLLYSDKALDKKLIEEEFSYRKDIGLDVELIDSNNSSFSFPLKHGVLGKNGGCELDPYKFTSELLKVSKSFGVNVYENTEAKQINYFDDFVEVITNYNIKIKCKKLIVATGYNTDLFTKKHFATKYTTFNIVTSPLKSEPWKNKVLIRDTSDPYNYLRSTFDNRIILGGQDIDFKDINNKNLCAEKYSILENKLRDMFNNLDFSIDYKYCGCFASTKDNLGFIGPSNKENKNLWYCLGYGANGILFAILGGLFLSKLYKGEYDENMKIFSVDRFDN